MRLAFFEMIPTGPLHSDDLDALSPLPLRFHIIPPASPPRPPLQVLSICGGGMLIFQMFVFPVLIDRLGVKRAQRWCLAFTIPVYLTVPLLSRLHGTRLPLFAASLALLFVINTAGSVVRAFLFL